MELFSSQIICSLTVDDDDVEKHDANTTGDVPKAAAAKEREAASVRNNDSSAGIPVSNDAPTQHRFDWKHLGESFRSLKSPVIRDQETDETGHVEDSSKALSDNDEASSPYDNGIRLLWNTCNKRDDNNHTLR